jgi:histidine triad (HIT) family protein
MDKCLFCQIVAGEAPSDFVLETEGFLVIKNKYPKAPIHLLVLDKNHRVKSDTIKIGRGHYWDDVVLTAYLALCKAGLDKTGYKLVVNGAGYNHFEHEHLHIMGGTKEEPDGST